MDLITFDNCKRDIGRQYNGSDRKIGLIYRDRSIMLKLARNYAGINDIDTSSVNNVISEYIGSHIFNACGIKAQETVLGTFNDILAVGCLNFVKDEEQSFVEFNKFVREHFFPQDIGNNIDYNQLYVVFDRNPVLREINKATVERYWDTFVIDALIGNFKRNKNDWGYIFNSKNESLICAPVYDNGSSLFPELSDDEMRKILDDENEILKRVYEFPKSCLEINGSRISYYDMLASGFDENATRALARMIDRIDLSEIDRVIDNTPMIGETRKKFYKTIIRYRFERLLLKAYEKTVSNTCDGEALKRIESMMHPDRKTVKDYDYYLSAGDFFIRDNVC